MLLGPLHFTAAVALCAVSTVTCGPMPRPLWIDDDDDDDKQHQARQNERAIDRFSTKLVGNRRIRENYLDCFLENGPCSPEASNIKRMIPEAIQKECEHCTELQKKVIEKMMCYLNNHQPDILQQVAAKFDPNGEYMKQYINTIEKKQNQPSLRPQLYQPQQPQNPPQQHQGPQQQQPQHPQQQPQHPQQQPQHPQQQPQHPQQGNECETCDQNYQPQQPQQPRQPQQPQHPQQQPQRPQQQPQNPQQQPQHPTQNQHPQQGNECETCDQNYQPQQPQHPPQQHHHSQQQPQQPPQQHQHQPNQYQPQNQHTPQQPQYQHNPQQKECETCEQNQGHQYQHQHQQQHQQRHQQQYQHEQQLKTTVVTSSPISTGPQKH